MAITTTLMMVRLVNDDGEGRCRSVPERPCYEHRGLLGRGRRAQQQAAGGTTPAVHKLASAAEEIVRKYLEENPELAAEVDETVRQYMIDVARMGELFGQPALV